MPSPKTNSQPDTLHEFYTMHVCSLCGGERFVSTEEDSWCEDCKEWMSAREVIVSPVVEEAHV